MNFTPLNLPPANLKITKKNLDYFVWCIIRKKKLKLTPEEWVRQHIIHYLIFHRKFPHGLIASEIEIQINTQKRRCDLVLYKEDFSLLLLIECKAPEIPLTPKVVQQIMHYNNELKVPKIAISNGIQHEIIELDFENNKFKKLDDFI